MPVLYFVDKLLGLLPWRAISVGAAGLALGHVLGLFDAWVVLGDAFAYVLGGTADFIVGIFKWALREAGLSANWLWLGTATAPVAGASTREPARRIRRGPGSERATSWASTDPEGSGPTGRGATARIVTQPSTEPSRGERPERPVELDEGGRAVLTVPAAVLLHGTPGSTPEPAAVAASVMLAVVVGLLVSLVLAYVALVWRGGRT